jgi:hypothetical protein
MAAPRVAKSRTDGGWQLHRIAVDLAAIAEGAHAAAVARVRAGIATRTRRPKLGMTGVPLALCAALLGGAWWALAPLAACAWWWAPQDLDSAWIRAVGRGVVATEWAAVGADALAAAPRDIEDVGAMWIGAALVMAVIARIGGSS